MMQGSVSTLATLFSYALVKTKLIRKKSSSEEIGPKTDGDGSWKDLGQVKHLLIEERSLDKINTLRG